MSFGRRRRRVGLLYELPVTSITGQRKDKKKKEEGHSPPWSASPVAGGARPVPNHLRAPPAAIGRAEQRVGKGERGARVFPPTGMGCFDPVRRVLDRRISSDDQQLAMRVRQA
jgi:hypothetical protein